MFPLYYEQIFLYVLLLDDSDHHITGLLVKYFGFTTFKDWQLRTIKAVLEGKDSFVVQPTGSGKSICFQLPSLITRKVTIVLTPTISLMNDQCKKLEQRGILATFLGSSQSDKDVDVKIKQGMFQLVYCTPEKFFDHTGLPSNIFSHLIDMKRIGLIAIDEAHLINSWVSFRYVNRVSKYFPPYLTLPSP